MAWPLCPGHLPPILGVRLLTCSFPNAWHSIVICCLCSTLRRGPCGAMRVCSSRLLALCQRCVPQSCCHLCLPWRQRPAGQLSSPWCTSVYTRACQPPPPQGAHSSTPSFRKQCSQQRCLSGSNVSRPLPMPMGIFSNWLRRYVLCSTRRHRSRCGCARRPTPLHLRRGVARGLPEHHEAHDEPISQRSDGAPTQR